MEVVAETGAGTAFTLPIVGLGADGVLGTGDVEDRLFPGGPSSLPGRGFEGEAEYLFEGRKEGFHRIDFDITGTLEGLPVGHNQLQTTALRRRQPLPQGRRSRLEGRLCPRSSSAKEEVIQSPRYNRRVMATTTESKTESSGYVYSHITKIPGVCGGRPAIDGTRVRVLNIVYLHKQGYTLEQMLEEYPLTLAQVHAALAYYYDHREEIEGYIKEDEAWDERHERDKAEFLSKRSSSSRR